MAMLTIFSIMATRNPQKRPGKLQNLAELLYEFFENLTVSVVGDHGRKFTPLIGTLFLFILSCNLIGLVPASVAPTASLNITLALALIVFVYVQYIGIRSNGLAGYLGHFAGAGKVPVYMAPLLFVIELISELTKPVSLSIRLFGNMFGKEQVMLALILAFGVPALKYFIPFPVQLPILLFGVLVAFVQAFVFSLLTGIYLGLMTEHEAHHGHEDAHAH